jgi:Uma2 family endonuclease
MNHVQPIEVPQPVKLTVDDFLLLAESGAFDHLPKKVELLDGVITVMSPLQTRHSFVTTELIYRLKNKLAELGSPLDALIGATLTARPLNAPEPDIFVTNNPRGEGYADASEAQLVIEVSNTTAQHDLGKKRRIYAAASIPEYWVFDIPKSTIHRFWRPRDDDFAEGDRVYVPGHVKSVFIDGLEIGTEGLI